MKGIGSWQYHMKPNNLAFLALQRVADARRLCEPLKVFWKPNQFGKQDSKKTRHATWEVLDTVKDFCELWADDIVVELASSDELYIDITAEVGRRMETMKARHIEEWPYHTFFKIQVPETTVIEHQTTTQRGPFSYKIQIEGYSRNRRFPHFYIEKEQERLIFGAAFMHQLSIYLAEKTQLSSSCGVATNKLLAKVGCELNKPGKITILPETSLRRVSFHILISDIPGLKGKTGQMLMDKFNIKTMKELEKLNFNYLVDTFGPELAKKISSWSLGKDNDLVVAKDEMCDFIKCRKPEHSRINRWTQLVKEVENRSAEIQERLKEEKCRHRMICREVRVHIEFQVRGKTENCSFQVDVSSFKKMTLLCQNVLASIKELRNFDKNKIFVIEFSLSARDFQSCDVDILEPIIQPKVLPSATLRIESKVDHAFVPNFDKMVKMGEFQTTSKQTYSFLNHFRQLLPDKKLQFLVGRKLHPGKGQQMIEDHTQYNEFKHNCLLYWLQSEYKGVLSDPKKKPDFVVSQGRITATLMTPMAIKNGWEMFGVNFGGSIYLWDEKNPTSTGNAFMQVVGSYFTALVTTPLKDTPKFNDYHKTFVLNEVAFGTHKLLLLNHLGAQHEGGSFVQVCKRKTMPDLNDEFSTFLANKVWAQIVVSGSKHVLIGTAKSIRLEAIRRFSAEEFIDKYAKGDSTACFRFQDRLFSWIKEWLPESDPNLVIKFSWVPGNREAVANIVPQQIVQNLIVPRLYSPHFHV